MRKSPALDDLSFCRRQSRHRRSSLSPTRERSVIEHVHPYPEIQPRSLPQRCILAESRTAIALVPPAPAIAATANFLSFAPSTRSVHPYAFAVWPRMQPPQSAALFMNKNAKFLPPKDVAEGFWTKNMLQSYNPRKSLQNVPAFYTHFCQVTSSSGHAAAVVEQRSGAEQRMAFWMQENPAVHPKVNRGVRKTRPMDRNSFADSVNAILEVIADEGKASDEDLLPMSKLCLAPSQSTDGVLLWPQLRHCRSVTDCRAPQPAYSHTTASSAPFGCVDEEDAALPSYAAWHPAFNLLSNVDKTKPAQCGIFGGQKKKPQMEADRFYPETNFDEVSSASSNVSSLSLKSGLSAASVDEVDLGSENGGDIFGEKMIQSLSQTAAYNEPAACFLQVLMQIYSRDCARIARNRDPSDPSKCIGVPKGAMEFSQNLRKQERELFALSKGCIKDPAAKRKELSKLKPFKERLLEHSSSIKNCFSYLKASYFYERTEIAVSKLMQLSNKPSASLVHSLGTTDNSNASETLLQSGNQKTGSGRHVPKLPQGNAAVASAFPTKSIINSPIVACKRFNDLFIKLGALPDHECCTVKSLKIPREEIEHNYIIGQQNGIKTVLAIYTQHQPQLSKKGVAAKVIPRSSTADYCIKRMVDLFRVERFLCPHLLLYRFVQDTPDFWYLARDACDWNLDQYLSGAYQEETHIVLTTVDLERVFREIIQGLSFLHNRHPLFHGNLKPSNILIDSARTTRLSDFGFGRLCTPPHEFNGPCRNENGLLDPKCWRPIEYYKPQIQYNSFSDIHTAGMLAYYILSTAKHHPFIHREDCTLKDLQMRVVHNDHNLQHVPPLAADLVEDMLCPEWQDRPSCATVIAHPFFWSNQRRCSFLLAVAYQGEFRDALHAQQAVGNRQLLDQLAYIRLPSNWKSLLPVDLVEFVSKSPHSARPTGAAHRDKSSAVDFFEFLAIGNEMLTMAQLHGYDDRSLQQQLSDAIAAHFPMLFIGVFNAIKRSAWKHRSTINIYF